MIHQYKKHLTFAAVLACVALAAFLGIGYLKKVKDSAVYATQINTIKEASGVKKINDFHKRVDKLRVFINKNSQHKQDEEFYANWRDRTKMAQIFIDHLEGRRKTLPHMECSTRASMMGAILNSEGYRTRAIDAYRVEKDQTLFGHALLDVFNPETKAWETQDPEYDVYWKNTKTGQRTSIVEAVSNKSVIPCNAKGCGWWVTSHDGNRGEDLKKQTAYLTTIDKNAHERITFYRPDLKPETTLTLNGKKGTYCDLLSKNCKDGFLASTKDNLKQVIN